MIADELAANDKRIYVHHRPAKEGLGRAYIDGFKVALERGADLIFDMDADFSITRISPGLFRCVRQHGPGYWQPVSEWSEG